MTDYNIFRKAAHILRAFNNDHRKAILEQIGSNEMSVEQIQKALNMEQSIASQHLAILRHAGVVTFRQQGKNKFYYINQDRLGRYQHIAQQLTVQNDTEG